MAENYSDISCQRTGNLVYVKCDGVIVMVITIVKDKTTIAFSINGNWNSVESKGLLFSVEDMEREVVNSIKGLL